MSVLSLSGTVWDSIDISGVVYENLPVVDVCTCVRTGEDVVTCGCAVTSWLSFCVAVLSLVPHAVSIVIPAVRTTAIALRIFFLHILLLLL